MLPASSVKDSCTLTDKTAILDCFNKHCVSSGSLFESLHSDPKQPREQRTHSSPPPLNSMVQPFNLTHLDVIEVHRALKQLEPNKSRGPDQLDLYFYKLAGDFIAEPLTRNFTLSNNETPTTWKSACVFPFLRGRDPSVVNIYRPIS